MIPESRWLVRAPVPDQVPRLCSYTWLWILHLARPAVPQHLDEGVVVELDKLIS